MEDDMTCAAMLSAAGQTSMTPPAGCLRVSGYRAPSFVEEP
jgi:hypothetical protein